MIFYDSATDFPAFSCDDCGSANTWTSPIPVTQGGEVVAFAPGARACFDCWERLPDGPLS